MQGAVWAGAADHAGGGCGRGDPLREHEVSNRIPSQSRGATLISGARSRRDHPLALYVFSKDAKFKNKVFDNTQSGSAIANESILQIGGAHPVPVPFFVRTPGLMTGV